MRLPLPLASSARRTPNAVSRLVNMQAEGNPPDAKGPARIFRTPGVRAYKTLGDGPGRGLHVFDGALYAVSGDALWRVANQLELGYLPGTGKVAMANNGSVIFLVAGTYGFTWNGTTLAAVTDADFRPAKGVDFLDGYFTFVEALTGRFFVSDLYSTNFDALKFATAEGSPDPLVDHIVDHREVVLLGTKTIERWWNSAAGNFPLERSPGGFHEIGCLGGVAKADNTVFWVANDGTVRALRGGIPTRVSTHGVEEAIAGYTGTPEAYTYTCEGHVCYVVSWTEATWGFDITTGEWNERRSYLNERSRICAAVELNGVVYVQDRDTGAVGILDPETYTEFGDVLVAEWTYPAIYAEGKMLAHTRLELMAEMGVGPSDGTDVPLMLSYSDDGKEFHGLPSRELGKVGERDNRAVWDMLGASRERIYRMSVSAAVPVNVFDTQIEVR